MAEQKNDAENTGQIPAVSSIGTGSNSVGVMDGVLGGLQKANQNGASPLLQKILDERIKELSKGN